MTCRHADLIETGHDIAGGAVYFRLSDAILWLSGTEEMKRYNIMRPKKGDEEEDTKFSGECNRVVFIEKAREGRGTGKRVGFIWRGLEYAEQGVLLGKPLKVTELSESSGYNPAELP